MRFLVALALNLNLVTRDYLYGATLRVRNAALQDLTPFWTPFCAWEATRLPLVLVFS
jgi:hypothetical protein